MHVTAAGYVNDDESSLIEDKPSRFIVLVSPNETERDYAPPLAPAHG